MKPSRLQKPNTITLWLLMVLGIVAFISGVFGVVDPQTQLVTGGFKDLAFRPYGDYTLAFLFALSIVAIINGLLHVVGVLLRWPYFVFYVLFSRLLMAIGFTHLFIYKAGYSAFKWVAVFEWGIILLICLALLVDYRMKRAKNPVKKKKRKK